MSVQTAEVGGLPLQIGQYNVSINSATSIVMPTPAQMKPAIPGTSFFAHGGTLVLQLSLEGQNARWRTDGQAPNTTNGMLLVQPGNLVIRGQFYIAAFQIVGLAAGGIINYTFSVDDIAL